MSAPEPLSKISCTVDQKIETGHFQQEFISKTIYKMFWPGDGVIEPLLQRVLELHNFLDNEKSSLPWGTHGSPTPRMFYSKNFVQREFLKQLASQNRVARGPGPLSNMRFDATITFSTLCVWNLSWFHLRTSRTQIILVYLEKNCTSSCHIHKIFFFSSKKKGSKVPATSANISKVTCN